MDLKSSVGQMFVTWKGHPMLIICGVILAFAQLATVSCVDQGQHSHRITKRGILENKGFDRKLRIATIEDRPYVMINKDGENLVFSGFIPDIVQALSRRIRFDYEYYAVEKYGQYNDTTGQWNGLIGEVILRDKSETEGADIAAAAITVTPGREKVVDFLKPFQHLGISVVVKRPDVSINFPFTFGIFQPLEPAVWGLIALAFIVVGLFLWLMNMFNPYEWAGRYDVGQADALQAQHFNLAGSMWFVFTTMQWQGFERTPRSIASKCLACVWFVFVTVCLVTYTAGVVNHLYWASMTHRSTTTRPRFLDLGHIVASKDMKYGTIKGGMTYRYIMQAAAGEEFDAIRRYWATSEGAEQLVGSKEEGLRRVREGNYAFIMETLSARHEVNQRPCDLVTVGEPFGRRGYGFALPANATPRWFLDELHLAVLEMEEEGDLEELEHRWFTGSSQCWNVTRVERVVADVNEALYVNEPKRVDVTMFTGPFVLLVVGIVFSIAIALAEMMYYRHCVRYQASGRSQASQLNMEPDEGNI